LKGGTATNRQEDKHMKERGKRIYWGLVTKRMDGIGVIEVILILVIIIGLVLLFKNQIKAIIDQAFLKITNDTTSISN